MVPKSVILGTLHQMVGQGAMELSRRKLPRTARALAALSETVIPIGQHVRGWERSFGAGVEAITLGPVPRKRRKKATRKRTSAKRKRATPKRRTAKKGRRTAAQRAATKRMVAANKRRGGRKAARKRGGGRRKNAQVIHIAEFLDARPRMLPAHY